MKITVIGNGASRAPIPLDKISGITIGCNEVHRDFTPDYLCIIDHGITQRMYDSDYSAPIYYRHMTLKRLGLEPKENWHSPDFMNGQNTGNAAILLAKSLGATDIDLLGFDGVVGSKLYMDTAQPNDKFDMWNEQLLWVCEGVNVRRVVYDKSAEMPFPTITVENYIEELNESNSNR